MDNKKIADLLFPNAQPVEYWEQKFPRRNLKPEQEVTRYAPSPTGFMHLGNFFQMFISYSIARNTNGVFIKRLEDTDAKREKENAFEVIKQVMDRFHIIPNEYQEKGEQSVGNYGPYIQSMRKDTYASYAKKLVAEGKAFPCFCKATEGKEDVLKSREEKFAENEVVEYDPCRDLTLQEVEQHLKNGDKFAIRLRTNGTGTERVKFVDLIKGEINAQANCKDVVLLKQDGIPPYTFAHIIDDYLMGVTTIVRGEEYISSTPFHIEIINALGLPGFKYCHNPLICKIPENGNKRKISKRYDPEADMRYYFEKGYPLDSVLEYLLNLISSSFEPWLAKNPNAKWSDFKFTINDITAVSPLLDMVKLNDISKNYVATLTAEEVYDNVFAWAKEFNTDFANKLENNKQYFVQLFSIDRGGKKSRKDIRMWSEVEQLLGYAFLGAFDNAKIEDYELEDINKQQMNEVVKTYSCLVNFDDDKQAWFDRIKEMSAQLGYATNNQEYQQNPQNYKGNVATVCEYIRIALTGRKNSYDLFSLIQLFKKEETLKRFNKFLELNK